MNKNKAVDRTQSDYEKGVISLKEAAGIMYKRGFTPYVDEKATLQIFSKWDEFADIINSKEIIQNLQDMNAQEKEDYLFVQDKRFSHLYSTLPESRRTYNVSWAAVESDPKNLEFVPDRHLDKEIIKMAAQKDGFAIEYIPSHKLDRDIYKIAVNQNGGVLELVPKDLRTPELCLDAVKNNGWALEFVPEKSITPEVAEIAVKNHPSSLQWVPEKMLTPDMILYTVKKMEHFNASIPENMNKGNNIYTFHKKVEDVVNKPLSYNEHRRLYAGESINVGTVHTHGGNILPNCVLTYNKENNTLNLRNIAINQKKQPKEDIKPTHQKPTKTRGRKL